MKVGDPAATPSFGPERLLFLIVHMVPQPLGITKTLVDLVNQSAKLLF